eukprot:TRINITY_DN18915_c0_g2_i4.p1 TRINITY_DN18915_c0_g2~~TRINITY_DN18915_c0_g2_i4.p1  ORF type:complete len:128 (+),score=11.72 TRINITY_DN18915_c0_g2_i4:261-644(+)
MRWSSRPAVESAKLGAASKCQQEVSNQAVLELALAGRLGSSSVCKEERARSNTKGLRLSRCILALKLAQECEIQWTAEVFCHVPMCRACGSGHVVTAGGRSSRSLVCVMRAEVRLLCLQACHHHDHS